MKKIFTTLLVAAALMMGITAKAQVKFGVKGGVNVTSMSFNNSVFDASNRTGFFIGPTVKIQLPLVGLGIDASALYDQREAKLKGEVSGYEADLNTKVKQQAINIPVNLRYTFGLGDIAGVYLAAGPQFGFNVGDKNFDMLKAANYKLKSTNFSVNVGAGVTLINHLEIGFNYNIACGKTGEVTGKSVATETIKNLLDSEGKSNAWQISAAYYF